MVSLRMSAFGSVKESALALYIRCSKKVLTLQAKYNF